MFHCILQLGRAPSAPIKPLQMFPFPLEYPLRITRTRRGIEVVITGLTRNQLGRKPTWVRIPPSPPPRDSTNDRRDSVRGWVPCLFSTSKLVDLSRDLALLHVLFLRHFEPKTSSQNRFRVSFRKYLKKPISNSFALPGGVHFPFK